MAHSTTSTSPRSDHRFLNPYNFIRFLREPQVFQDDEDTQLLGRCAPPPHDRWVGLSGTIVCEVEAVSPLFISDSEAYYATGAGHETDAEKDHRTYRFYRYDFGSGPELALPASSLRGTVRGAFEAVTNSCFAHFDYAKRLSYHLPAADALKLTPARIEKDKHGRWQLHLLSGTARLVVGTRPHDKLYAARVERYEAIKPAGKRPRGQSAAFRPVSLGGLKHGEDCYALIEELKFPPVWNVVKLSKDRAALEREATAGRRVVYGYICLNNQNIETKRFERFFFRAQENKAGADTVPLPEDARIKYRELIEDYQTRHAATIEQLRRKRKDFDPEAVRVEKDDKGREQKHAAFSRFIVSGSREAQHGDLVYAMLSGAPSAPTIEFIVPVAVPRVGYQRKIAHLLPRHLWKCAHAGNLCPACRTFGWVYGREREDQGKLNIDEVTAYAGRLRFTHGKLLAPAEALPLTALSILSSPKPTTTRFYLKPADDRPRAGQDEFQAGYDNRDNMLRGRKFYRHHGHANDGGYWRDKLREYRHAGANSEQNRSVEDALAPGAKFSFNMRFENLAEIELGALLWSLELGGEGYHRLGFAKPLGFGSIKIKVSEVSLLDPQARYGPDWADGERKISGEPLAAWAAPIVERFKKAMCRAYQQSFDELSHVKDLRALTGDPEPELPIHYPRTDERPSPEGKNFEWFMGNNRNKDARFVLEMPGEEKGLPLIDKTGTVKK